MEGRQSFRKDNKKEEQKTVGIKVFFIRFRVLPSALWLINFYLPINSSSFLLTSFAFS